MNIRVKEISPKQPALLTADKLAPGEIAVVVGVSGDVKQPERYVIRQSTFNPKFLVLWTASGSIEDRDPEVVKSWYVKPLPKGTVLELEC